MAGQDRWNEDRDRGRYAEEDRFRRGGAEQRSFDGDPEEDHAYAAGYGIDDQRFGQHSRGSDHRDERYGGQWGRGPGDTGGSGGSGQGYGGDARHGDVTWMERTGERIASWFGGGEVERSHRGRGPKNYSRSDERILEDVNEWLMADPYVDASEISVRVDGGEVVLSGSATSRDERHRAEEVAERVLGVRHVQNNVRVERPEADDGPLPVPMV